MSLLFYMEKQRKLYYKNELRVLKLSQDSSLQYREEEIEKVEKNWVNIT